MHRAALPFRDTPILTGTAAHRRSRLVQIVAAPLADAAIMTPLLLWRVATLLLVTPPD